MASRLHSVIVAMMVAAAPLSAQSTKQTLARDPACQSLVPAAAGGPIAKAQDAVVVRWLGTTNYELTYRGSVFLLDAYYDRLPKSHPIGVAAKELRKATAIFIGHAHYEHMSDAASVGRQTGAAIVGARSVTEIVSGLGVPAPQIRTVKGGELLQFPGVTVQAVLGRHEIIASTVPAGHLERQQSALQAASLVPALSDTERQQAEAIRARGSNDPSLATEGVFGYLFTFGNDFRVMVVDSPGPVTDAQRQLMQKVPSVDVAMLPYVDFDAGIPPMVELAKVFKPATVFLGHHDGPGVALWASNYPAALALRDALPKVRTMDVLYRTPVCFSTSSKEMFIGW